MAIKKSELYSTLAKCTNKLRSNCGLNAELFKNYVLIMLFLKYISDRKRSGELELIEIPDGCSFEDIINLKNTLGIGDGINKIIGQIKDANEGVLDFINIHQHDFCDKQLGEPKEASNVLSELVSAFQTDGLDFTHNRAADDDLIGDAYEYLMRNFASQSGKDKGQFYTPTEVSRLMAKLIGIDRDTRRNVSVYDPTCGSGSLLLRTRAAAKNGLQVSLQGQELDHSNVEMCNLNMIIHGYEEADIRQGDTLNSPKHEHNGVLDQFNYIVSNPPFSLHNWMTTAKENDEYGRWNRETGVPPQQYGDFAFLMHVVRSLKHDGCAAIILPNGVLTRGGDEENLRRWLVDQNLISGIVALPTNTFYGTGIAGNIIVIDKNRSRDGIFFIDASRGFYKDEDSKNRLREQDLRRISDCWDNRKNIPGYARLASYDEIKREGYNLNIPRYVTSSDKEVEHNIEAHLHGGLPKADIDKMGTLWKVCPSLRMGLFAEMRPGFYSLNADEKSVANIIENDPDFIRQHEAFVATIEKWCDRVRPLMLEVDVDCHPKEVIEKWSAMLLDSLDNVPTLIDAYDAYDQLMNYWAESMQDDLYMVSRDGWGKISIITPKKKSYKWTDLYCDLLPVSLVVDKFFADKRDEYFDTESLIDDLAAELKETSENEDGEVTMLLDNPKERKKKERQLKDYKLALKTLNLEIISAIANKYHSFTAPDVCRLVVEDKWLADIKSREITEVDKVAADISAQVVSLNQRYASTLSALEKEVAEAESTVLNHLKTMGFEL